MPRIGENAASSQTISTSYFLPPQATYSNEVESMRTVQGSENPLASPSSQKEKGASQQSRGGSSLQVNEDEQTHTIVEEDVGEGWGNITLKAKSKAVLSAVAKFKQRSALRISTLDQATMSPFAKFRHYGRVPCKLVLNVLIFVLLMFVIVAYELPASFADEAERKIVQLHFINAVIGDSDIEAIMPGGDDYINQPIIYLFERSEVLGAIGRVVETYYSLASISLNDFDVLFNDKGPYEWVPPNVSSSSAAGALAKVPPASSDVGILTEKELSDRSARARKYLGTGGQLDYVNGRRTFYINSEPASPPPLSVSASRLFTARSTAGDRAGGATLSESYFDYVVGMFEDKNITDPYLIQNNWMLQPILQLTMLTTSARVDWRVETNNLLSRSFYLARDAPLGPFATDEAVLTPDSNDPDDVAVLDPVDGDPFWLEFVCGPRPDPFFADEHYLPCRELLDDSDDGNTSEIVQRKFRMQSTKRKPKRKRPAKSTTVRQSAGRKRKPNAAMPQLSKRALQAASSSDAPGSDKFHANSPFGMFDQVQQISVNLRFQQVCSAINDKEDSRIGLFYRDALYYWNINVVFATDLNGRVMVTFPVTFEERRGIEHLYVTFFAILFLGILSVWDLVLRVRAIQHVYQFRHMLRKKMKRHLRLLEEQRIREEEEQYARALATFFDNTDVNWEANSLTALWQAQSDEEVLLNQSLGKSPASPTHSKATMLWKGIKRLARGEGFSKLRPSSRRGSAAASPVSPSFGRFPNDDPANSIYSAVIRPVTKQSNLSHGDIYQSSPKLRLDTKGADGGLNTTELPQPPHHVAESDCTLKFKKKWKRSLHADMGLSWHMCSIVSNLLNIIYVCYTTAMAMQITSSIESSRTLRVVLGLSVMGSTALFVSYLRFFPKLYFMIRATSGSVARLCIFLLGVLPIYLGFALFFTTVSSSTSTGMFETIFSSMVALSFAWFGDNLLPDFQAATDSSLIHIQVATNVMMFLFIAMAMYCVLNLLLAIVSDSYMEVRARYGLTIAPQDWYKRTAAAKNTPGVKGGSKKNRRGKRGAVEGALLQKKGLLVTTAKQRMRNDALREVKRQLELLASTFDSTDDEAVKPNEAANRLPKAPKNKGKKQLPHVPSGVDNHDGGAAEDAGAVPIPVININGPVDSGFYEPEENDVDDVQDERAPLLRQETAEDTDRGVEEGESDEEDTDEETEEEDRAEAANLLDSYGGLLSEPDLDLRLLSAFHKTKSMSRAAPRRPGSFIGSVGSQSRFHPGSSAHSASSSNYLGRTNNSASRQSAAELFVGREAASQPQNVGSSRPQSAANFLVGRTKTAGSSQSQVAGGLTRLLRPASSHGLGSSPPNNNNSSGSLETGSQTNVRNSISAANPIGFIPLQLRQNRSRSVIQSDSDFTSSSLDSNDSTSQND